MDVRSVTPPPRLGPQGAPLTAEEDALITASQKNSANPLKVTLAGKKGNWDIYSFYLPNGSGGSTLFFTTVRNNDIYNNPVWYKYSTLADAQDSNTAVAAAAQWGLSAIPQMVDARKNLVDAPLGAAASSVAKKTGWFGMGGARRRTRRGRKNRKNKSRKNKSRRS